MQSSHVELRRCKVVSHEILSASSPVRIPRTRSELESSPILPPSAVVLLNSPSVGAWELREWKRLFAAVREAPQPGSDDALPCYFVCADGAYSTMKRRGAELGLKNLGEPDVVIGDMDSLNCTDPSMRAVRSGSELCFPTVAEVPRTVLELIRARALSGGAPPLFIHIACQMTTDFQKAALLVELLEETFPSDFPRLCFSSANESVSGVMSGYMAAYRATVGSGSDSDDPEEMHRTTSLLRDVLGETMTPDKDEHTLTNFLFLPNVVVFGALGGRFDHEMACANCVLQHSQRYNMLVANEFNIITACLPDGITQWLTTMGEAPIHRVVPHKCGVIPMGTIQEMETTGLQYNVVKGRPGRYDGYTQTDGYRFAFDALISSCNTVTSPIVTVDLRPLHQPTPALATLSVPHNPPTLLTTSPPPNPA